MASLFFHEGILKAGIETALEEDTARHVGQVLRMQPGETIMLTNGKGHHASATITKVQKRQCTVAVSEVRFHERKQTALHLAVAFTKNSSRNEWILEKVTELGVTTIIPLQTTRSEREKFRYERWHNIIVAAIIQSQQYYLPELRELTAPDKLAQQMKNIQQKLVAHCMEGISRQSINKALQKDKETLLLIGPEGDFTDEEVEFLTSEGFSGISMGDNRLRTETAAVTACAFFNMVNHG